MASKTRLLNEAITDLDHRFSKRNDWTVKEINILEKNYKIMSRKELALLLPGRSIHAIQSMKSKLGFCKKLSFWTEQEIAILKNHYGKEPFKDTQKRLTVKSRKSIHDKVTYLGLTVETWTEEQVAILKKQFFQKTIKELSKELKKSNYSISGKANRLGLIKFKNWDIDEIAILKEFYGKESMSLLEKRFSNRTADAIIAKAALLGLQYRYNK